MIGYRDVVSKIDLRELMAPGKSFRGNNPVKIMCPWHNDTTPSLAIYHDHAYCYGCYKRVSILEWIAEENGLDIASDFRSVVELANSKYVGLISLPSSPLRTPNSRIADEQDLSIKPLDISFAKYCHDHLGEKRAWFTGRGLTDQVIDSELLGYLNNAFTIPVWNSAWQLLTMRYRRDDTITQTGSKYWGIKTRNRAFLYNSKALTRDYMRINNGLVVLCEGELDCLRLWCEGINSVSFTNGVGAFRPEFVPSFSLASRILVAFDIDNAGQKEAHRIADMLGDRASIMTWDASLGKDITDLANNQGIDYVKNLISGEVNGI